MNWHVILCMDNPNSNTWRTIALVLIGIAIGFLLARFNLDTLQFEPPEEKVVEEVAEEPITVEKEELPNVEADDDPFLGPEDAKVVIIEFSDYECPFCKQLFEDMLPQFKKDFIETGKVKYVFRDFPLGIHKNAENGALAANCAGQQGKYWEMHDLLFEQQEIWTQANDVKKQLTEFAQELRLNQTRFTSCLESEEQKAEIQKDRSDGIGYGVKGTPSLFINGELLRRMPREYEDFKSLIEEQL